MCGESLPDLPKELERYLERPYGGLFGDTVIAQVVEEIVADPHSDYRPKDLEDLTGASSPAVRKALSALTSLELLIKDASDSQHPVYRVNTKSKKFVALTLLAYAVLDDRDGTSCVDTTIRDYYNSALREYCEPLAMATAQSYECSGSEKIRGSELSEGQAEGCEAYFKSRARMA
jgi:hypothetical protein